MRYLYLTLAVLCGAMSVGHAQTVAAPSLESQSIGINLPAYPQLILVRDLPVYYALRLKLNFFFHDGSYWVYRGQQWYTSTWYNGPWLKASPNVVPLYVLRVPVAYFRNRPPQFRGWQADALPRWGQLWGKEWERGRPGWDRWDRSTAPAPAPLPFFQRRFTGKSYPQLAEQGALSRRHYPYPMQETVAPRDEVKQGVQSVSTQSPGVPGKVESRKKRLPDMSRLRQQGEHHPEARASL